eukprot:796968-Rhodomonas_salina.3
MHSISTGRIAYADSSIRSVSTGRRIGGWQHTQREYQDSMTGHVLTTTRADHVTAHDRARADHVTA